MGPKETARPLGRGGKDLASEEVVYLLALDGAYYHEAKLACARVAEIQPGYDRWVTEITGAHEEIIQTEAKYENRLDAYDEVEHLVTKLDRDWENFVPVARDLASAAASVIIMCATCLEAHINIHAQSTLSTREFLEFDSLSLTGKWLLYPKIAGKGKFDAGSEPIQSIHRLATARNRLVHYKMRKEKRQFGYEIPGFLNELQLDAKFSREAVETVELAVQRLAAIEGRSSPEWFSDPWWSIIDFIREEP
jgi:hypothetical protein